MEFSSLAVRGSLAAAMLCGVPTPSENLRPVLAWWDEEGTGGDYRQLEDRSFQIPGAGEVGYFIDYPTDDAGAKLVKNYRNKNVETGSALRLYRHLHTRQLEMPWNQGNWQPALPGHLHAITWIQRATGMSDGSLANLLGVSRMAILDWKAGKPVREKNRRRLLETQDVLKRAAEHHSGTESLVTWLDTPVATDGISPFKLLQEGEIERALFWAIQTSAGVAPVPDWAKRPIAPEWQGALETRERPGEFSEFLRSD